LKSHARRSKRLQGEPAEEFRDNRRKRVNTTCGRHKLKQQFLAPGLVAIALALAPSMAAAVPSGCAAVSGNLVLNCGFETGTFSDWTVGGNTSDLTISSLPEFAHSGNDGVAFGEVGSDGFLSQTLTTAPGRAYTISVWYDPSGASPSNFDIQWDGLTLLSLSNVTPGWLGSGSPAWRDEVVDATGTGRDTLTLGFRDVPSFSGLDDISVTDPPPPIPEPASLLALGSALLGLGFCRRRDLL
jgi:type 1 fimbria pilin